MPAMSEQHPNVSTPLIICSEAIPFVLVRFPHVLGDVVNNFYDDPGEHDDHSVLGVLSNDLKTLRLNTALTCLETKKVAKTCNASVHKGTSETVCFEIIRRKYDEGVYGSRTTTHAVLFTTAPNTIHFNWPLKYLKIQLMKAPTRPHSILAEKLPSRTAALDNGNVFFKYLEPDMRARISQLGDSAIQTIRNRLFLLLERRGSEGVNIRDAVMESGANAQVVRKILDQIARPLGAAGRTIWVLHNQFTSL